MDESEVNKQLNRLRAKHAAELGVDYGGFFVDSVRFADRSLYVGSLRRSGSFPKGNGAKAMAELGALADDHGIRIELFASCAALVPWYRKLGFVEVTPGKQTDRIDMVRHPLCVVTFS
jgi:sugar phosphate isomerase/epimerase